ncbi:MAG: hypothetical protein IJV69_07075 [Kiritimatiellae bacterium]|nr:hypothetical protein [Kiritimatiellia bacterium]
MKPYDLTDVKHRMTRRLNGWDYRQRAIYFITLTLQDRTSLWLGRLTSAESDGAVKHMIQLTDYGHACLAALAELPKHYPQVSLLELQVMPEHVHVVLFVHQELPVPLGNLMRGVKAGARKRWMQIGEEQGLKTPQWAPGFQDTVLLHEHQLTRMCAYVRDNPRRLAEKQLHPDYFNKVRHIELPLYQTSFVGMFHALGNLHLLNYPLFQIQCSRRWLTYQRVNLRTGGIKMLRNAQGEPQIAQQTTDYQAVLNEALAAVAKGWVLLSPCIADGERQIAREVLNRGGRLVVLRNRGFPPHGEKPSGRAFDACAQGRLLQLAPAAWPYVESEKPMTRVDAIILNRLAQWIAAETAAHITYHGCQPSEVDALAARAVFAKPRDRSMDLHRTGGHRGDVLWRAAIS